MSGRQANRLMRFENVYWSSSPCVDLVQRNLNPSKLITFIFQVLVPSNAFLVSSSTSSAFPTTARWAPFFLLFKHCPSFVYLLSLKVVNLHFQFIWNVACDLRGSVLKQRSKVSSGSQSNWQDHGSNAVSAAAVGRRSEDLTFCVFVWVFHRPWWSRSVSGP